VVKCLFLKGNSDKKLYSDMSVTTGDMRPSYSKVSNLIAGFRTRHLSTENECSGRQTQVPKSENADAICTMMLDD
jgi:hypothetical protein